LIEQLIRQSSFAAMHAPLPQRVNHVISSERKRLPLVPRFRTYRCIASSDARSQQPTHALQQTVGLHDRRRPRRRSESLMWQTGCSASASFPPFVELLRDGPARLGVTPSALSHSMRQLEKRFRGALTASRRRCISLIDVGRSPMRPGREEG